jgi:hypothetical protein
VGVSDLRRVDAHGDDPLDAGRAEPTAGGRLLPALVGFGTSGVLLGH